MSQMSHSIRKGAAIIGFGAALAIFAYGVAVGKYEVFPYELIALLKSKVVAPSPEYGVEFIRTSLVGLTPTRFNVSNPMGFSDGGGALALLGPNIIGVDSDGRFFLYRGAGEIQNLDVSLRTAEDVMSQFLIEQGIETSVADKARETFRVLDIATTFRGGGVQIYVSHNYWVADEAAKLTRVSRLSLERFDDLAAGRSTVSSEDWEVVYETHPFVPFDEAPSSSFFSVASGGRMVFEPDGNLVVAFGDQDFDGVFNARIAAQDDTSSYGKVLKIDVETFEAKVIAKGVRNPQGLAIGRDGSVWETEHGPEGGDELNRIEEGSNYGWPYATYGTQYDQYGWPLSTAQGRHPGFDLPVFAWDPSIGVSNLIEVVGLPHPWDGDLLVSSLAKQKLYRIRIRAGRAVLVEPIWVGTRVRDLKQMADGSIVLWADNAELIELATATEGDTSAAAETDSAAAGTKLSEVVRGCRQCHALAPDERRDNAPPLFRVYGRRIASSEFPGYSNALRSLRGEWNDESLSKFLADPQQFAPGTTMPRAFTGDAETLQHLLRYLSQISSSPRPSGQN